MKPRLLSLHAFGPYPGEEQVDFTLLEGEGIFLIHGPTGAGKTFLLDAMAFALFGEVPGERSSVPLRCDLAPDTAEPWVELDFVAGGDSWRIRRVPAHERVGARGGLVPKPATANLARRTVEGWEVVGAKATEVKAKIHELLGLDAKQFQQVILLPQGRFERVLRADSQERENLLKTLFDTVLYEQVALHLDDLAKGERKALETSERELDRLRTQAWERWCELDVQERMHDSEGLLGEVVVDDVGPVDQVELDRLVGRAEVLADEARRAAAGAEASCEQTRIRLDEMEDLRKRWRSRHDLQARRRELGDAATEIDRLRGEHRNALDAEQVRPHLGDEVRAESEARAASAVVGEAAAVVAETIGRCTVALADEVAAVGVDVDAATPNQIDDAKVAVVRTAADLDALGDVAEKHRALMASADSYDAHERSATDATESARQAITDIDEQISSLEGRRQQAASAVAALPGLKDRAVQLEAVAEAVGGLQPARKELDQRHRDHQGDEAAVTQRRAELVELRARQIDGMAAHLAATLSDGDPCAVCGATEHPAPASADADAVAPEAVQVAEAAYEEAMGREREADRFLRDAQEQLRSLEQRCGDAGSDPDAARATARAAREKMLEAEAVASSVDQIDADLAAARVKRTTLGAQMAQFVADAERARTQAARDREDARGCDERLRRALGDETSLEEAQHAVSVVIDALGVLTEAVAGREKRTTLLDEASRRCRQAIERSPFSDADAVTAALRSETERAALHERIGSHDREMARVDTLLASDDLRDLPDHEPDLAEVTTAFEGAQHIAAACGGRAVRCGDAHVAMASWAERHRSHAADTDVQRRRAQTVSSLALRCTGRAAGGVSLQRWVLSSYLEEICELATARLQAMSAGRFSLKAHTDLAMNTSKSGLDLRILDAYSGEERKVQSLSGGETFQASLCLALAVADSVRAHAGGVQIDALFVDEGFGTLDPDALELAIDELDKLRSGGRTVGIISHVGALRERVSMGIEVEGSSQGSSLRVGHIGPT